MFDMTILRNHINELMMDNLDRVTISIDVPNVNAARVMAADATDAGVTIAYDDHGCKTQLMFTYNDVMFYGAHSIGVLTVKLTCGKHIMLRN